MRRILLTGLFVFLPAVAHAQAQGGPDPAPTTPPPEATPPAEAAPAPATTPAPATPPAATTAEPSTAGAGAAADTTGGVNLNLGVGAEASAPAPAPPPEPAKPVHAELPAPTRYSGAKSPDESAWQFSYHGYLRAPMRIGIGKRLKSDLPPGYDISGSRTTVHEATVPDDQYLSFQTTSHNMREWAEAFFTYGNQLAQGTVGFGSYNITEGGFNDTDANWGISQAYVSLTPDLGYQNVRVWAKAGAIVDKYGMAGRYDAGEYDTYMFGRTHVVGETAHLDFDLTPSWTLTFEQGFGRHKPDPNAYNTARYTMLHHEHLGLQQGRDLQFGAHYLMSWSQEEYRPAGFSTAATDLAPRNGLPPGHLWVAGLEGRAELGPFGYIYGAWSHIGADYAVSVSRAIEVLSASGGGEYDLGITGNYLDSPNCLNAANPNNPSLPTTPTPPENWAALRPRGCSDGNGAINAFQVHYEFSLTNFKQQIAGGQRFWGAGFDAILKLYGFMAFVDSKARDTTQAPKDLGSAVSPVTSLWEASPAGYKVTKTKLGADLTVQALPWLSPGLRFDRVMPNNHIPEQSFSILSPRIQFKSQWVTHERITLGYSHYFYDQRTCEPAMVPRPSDNITVKNPDPLFTARCTQPPPSPVPYDGFGSTTGKQDEKTRATGVTRPDENVFKIEATMWW